MIIIGQVSESKIYEDYFEVNFKEEREPNWNIQTGDSCFAITTQKEYEFTVLHYGLVPFWSTKREIFFEAPVDGGIQTEPGTEIKPRIIQTPAFRKPIRDTRCIVPADYFILESRGVTYLFFNQDRRPLSLAGVYDSWKPNIKEKNLHVGFSILTLPAYGIFAQLGIERVPYIIPGNKVKKYVREESQLLDITRMISDYSDEYLNGYEVDNQKLKENSRMITRPIGPFFRPYKNKEGGLNNILRRNKYRRGVTHDIDPNEQKIWRGEFN